MANQTTAMNPAIGGTPTSNGTLALTTSEKEWAFTSTVRYTQLQLVSDTAWYYGSQTSGPYTLVPANAAETIPIPTSGRSVFVKATTGTPTLYSQTVG